MLLNKASLFFIIIFIGLGFNSRAQYISKASGDWTNPSTWTPPSWSPNSIPDNNQSVTIAAGHTVTYNGDLSYGQNITIDGTLIVTGSFVHSNSLTISSTGKLIVGNNYTERGSSLIEGIVNVTGNFDATDNLLTVSSTGSLIVGGNISTKSFSISGKLKAGGNFAMNGGGTHIITNTGSFIIEGSASINDNLTIDGQMLVSQDFNLPTGGGVSISGMLAVGRNFTNTTGWISIAVNNSGRLLVIGDLTTNVLTKSANGQVAVLGNFQSTQTPLNCASGCKQSINCPSCQILDVIDPTHPDWTLSEGITAFWWEDFNSNTIGDTFEGTKWAANVSNVSVKQVNTTNTLYFTNNGNSGVTTLWQTQEINIQCYKNVSISGYTYNESIGNTSLNNLYYRIKSTSGSNWSNWTALSNTNGYNLVSGLNGYSIQIKWEVNSNKSCWLDNVGVSGTATCGGGNTVPSSPGAIEGAQTVCASTSGFTYSISPVTNATNYSWQVPSGWSVSAGIGTTTITVTSGVVGGTITVTAENANGSSSPQSKTVAVTSANTASNASSTPTLCINTTLIPITHTTTGATGITNDGVSGVNNLPSGVSAHWGSNQITISGTPTASGTFHYSIPLAGGCGTVNATGTIIVTPANAITLSSASGTDSQTKCINTAITNIAYSTTGATGATFSGLPNGVTGNWSGNVVTISGTPTTAGNNNYTVTLTGGCGNITATGSINVTANNTITLTSGAGTDAQTVCINSAISNITYTTTGATGATFGGLPSGVTGSYSAGTITISGAPTTATGSPFTYTITLTGGCGTILKTGIIIVNTLPTPIVGSNTPLCAGATLNLTSSGGTSYSWTGPNSFSSSSQNPDISNVTVAASGTYTVTVTDANQCVAKASTNVTVNALPTVFGVTGGGTYCSSGSEVAVGLSGSQIGVNYQLYRDGVLTGSPVPGTGSALSFSNLLAGIYTVQATLAGGECPVPMNGNATVSIGDFENPVITNCRPGGSYACVSNVPAGVGSITGFVAGVASVTDNCTAPDKLTVTFADVISHDTGCKVTRTYTIKDEAGNQATCNQVFTINDTQVPVINSVTDIVITPNDNSCGANLTINQPTDITENCSLVNEGAYYEYTIGGTLYTGHGNITALFPEGITVITWTVTDLCSHVSAPKTQTVQVGYSMTEIAYDNGSAETGPGSGIQPMRTSTHEYFVDNKTPESGYSYTWALLQTDGVTAVNSSLYTITNVNAAYIKITFTTIPTGNYILSVIKTKNEITCKKPKTLSVKVVENTFDTSLKPAGDNCQAGETGTPSTIIWEVTFPGGGVAPYSLQYAVNLTDDSNHLITACTGTVSNVTLTGTTASLAHTTGCGNTQTMPYMQVVKTDTNAYKVLLEYTVKSQTATDFSISIEIHGRDQFTVSEIRSDNNTETLKEHGVPNTSAITTD